MFRRLLRAKDRMDAGSHEPWPVRRLASVSGASGAHFARSFRDAFGVPPHRYLLTRRIERAKALLRDTNLPIIEGIARLRCARALTASRRQGCGRGVLAPLGGRIGSVTFGWAPVRLSRKRAILSVSSGESCAPSWLVPMTPTAWRRSHTAPV